MRILKPMTDARETRTRNSHQKTRTRNLYKMEHALFDARNSREKYLAASRYDTRTSFSRELTRTSVSYVCHGLKTVLWENWDTLSHYKVLSAELSSLHYCHITELSNYVLFTTEIKRPFNTDVQECGAVGLAISRSWGQFTPGQSCVKILASRAVLTNPAFIPGPRNPASVAVLQLIFVFESYSAEYCHYSVFGWISKYPIRYSTTKKFHFLYFFRTTHSMCKC